jgi:hypothetical protein
LSPFNLFRGLVVVSGDVHHADLIGVPPIEITSSGMTHTLAGPWYGPVLESITRFYSSHRLKPDALYTGLNWGRITLRTGNQVDSDESEVQTVGVAEVLDEEGIVRLSMPIAADPSRSLGNVAQQSPWTVYGGECQHEGFRVQGSGSYGSECQHKEFRV